jgi:hypothetical protein
MVSVKQVVAILIVILCCGDAFSQNDTCNVKISLLTCGPGQELYSVFGHTAIRVKNNTFDIIYNYGTFDFDDPDFYSNFVKGKLDYFVSAEEYKNFIYEYQVENRSVIEQDLNLTCAERERLFNALRVNAREENKFYKYQYLFDNCSTRPRDIIVKSFNDSVNFKNILPYPPPTFRHLIHEYLDRGNLYWSGFGIDLLLASRIDRKVNSMQAMFLPDYLMKGFDSATIKSYSVVTGKRVLLRSIPNQAETGSWFTPLLFTIALLISGVALSFARKNWVVGAINIFDIAYFLILGLTGCFMLFMWLGTDHELCRDNYNILWALPTHLVMAFFVLRKYSFVRKYFLISAVISVLILISLPFLPQEMNAAFIPLILLSAIRSAFRSLKK